MIWDLWKQGFSAWEQATAQYMEKVLTQPWRARAGRRMPTRMRTKAATDRAVRVVVGRRPADAPRSGALAPQAEPAREPAVRPRGAPRPAAAPRQPPWSRSPRRAPAPSRARAGATDRARRAAPTASRSGGTLGAHGSRRTSGTGTAAAARGRARSTRSSPCSAARRAGCRPVGQTPHEVAWTENKRRLLRFAPRERRHRTPVLLVPSLINRWYVLDLGPGRSFIEWLVAQGHEVLCIDWGTPGAEDRYLTWDDIGGRYLGRAVRIAARETGRTHPWATAWAVRSPPRMPPRSPRGSPSLTALAAPVDFEHAGMMSAWTLHADVRRATR